MIARLAIASIFLAVVTGQVCAQDATLRDRILEAMATPYYAEDSAVRDLGEWGDGAAPILIDLLQHPVEGHSPEKLVFYLGKTGKTEAVQSIIDYSMQHAADAARAREEYPALAALGSPEAVSFLLAEAVRPEHRNEIVRALHGLSSQSALDQMRAALSNATEDLRPGLERAIATVDDRVREAAALERARALPQPGSARLGEFWKAQESQRDANFAQSIVGEYTGKAYGATFSAIAPLDIMIEFKPDGTFATSLFCLTTGHATQYGRMDPVVSADGSAVYSGVYRVVSPSQLILGAGPSITTVAPSFRNGILSFYDAPAAVFVVASKKGTTPPAETFNLPDLLGVYKGAAVPIDAERQTDPISSALFDLAFTDTGTFVPGWRLPNSDRPVFPFTYYKGRYLVDSSGRAVLCAAVGGNDYGDASIMPFFDWYLEGMTLHLTNFDWHGSSHVAMTIDGSPLSLHSPAEFEDLTRGEFRGSAFRVTDHDGIEEITDVAVRFDADGAYHSNWSARLRKAGEEDFYPSDSGIFRLASPRHLLLGHRYHGINGISADATTDFLFSGNVLCFTSFAREAYFVLKREPE